MIIAYGSYPAQYGKYDGNRGTYTVNIDLSSYKFTGTMYGLLSCIYANGVPSSCIHSISTSSMLIGCSANASGIYLEWMVIGSWK